MLPAPSIRTSNGNVSGVDRNAASGEVRIVPHPTEKAAWLLTTSLWLPRPVEEVFEFFGDAGNLEAITPPWLRFRIVTPRPIAMETGALIDYRLTLHGWPLGWQTEIAEWTPPRKFIDRQLKGPYRLWVHEHTFEPAAGGTLVRDAVTYAVPGGRLIHALLVRRDLLSIFRFRQQAIQQRLAGDTLPEPGVT